MFNTIPFQYNVYSCSNGGWEGGPEEDEAASLVVFCGGGGGVGLQSVQGGTP